ncbi:MAG: Flp pilus assembly complex ATPase component TadA [Nitrospirae bacterium]|nr:Flp pilus assembly complex ATPase component TadA [Nitrospirota bacterium]
MHTGYDHRDTGHCQQLIDIIRCHLDLESLSDFYFASDSCPSVRINNDIKPVCDSKVTDDEIKALLNGLAFEGDSEKLPLDFGITFNGRRLRCNLDRRWQGLDLTIRLLPSRIKTLKELGFPEHLYQSMELKQGLVLICGPTGSGKSTTMASLIEYINSRYMKKIIMVEDPIEYIIKEQKSIISQRETGIGESFHPHLRSAMRQHPDIIVVGEIRDRETALVALQAAETGHLVLSTMHTDSAHQTVARFIDMQPEDMKGNVRSSLSAVLRTVLVQRLIRGKNGAVRVAYEICIVNRAISNIIRNDKLQQLPNQLISSDGCVPLNKSLDTLVSQGHITMEEAKRYSYDQEALQ